MIKNLLHSKKSLLTSVATSIGIATATLAPATGAMASGSVTPFTADYKFTVENKYNGTATRQLTQNGNTWNYKVNARVSGVATANQSSTFTIHGNTVSPSSASTTYRIFGLGRTHNLSFNPSTKKVVSTYRGRSNTFSAPNGALDDLSLETQIRQDLLSGRFTGNYYLAKKDKVERTPFRKAGNYRITVPAGTYDTVRIDRVHDDNSRSTSFWLAPSLNYLPVKMTQNNDGKELKMELTRVN
ncbi:DUF3108 domain-containing protein [Psychrobacter sp. I-STPA6b]|uniref:DUF3108 domain-containing protein n=1 Tax=Psychrobacter sp. I-STPA6b TaxID=2585718 RepID=UPI001D0CBBA8|nr:DUF3108 domain-containing protein [Psychrobacter sp. I-STPA6b]